MRPNREVIYRSLVAFVCFLALAYAVLWQAAINRMDGDNWSGENAAPLFFFLAFIYSVRATLLAWRHRRAVTSLTWVVVVLAYAPLIHLVVVGEVVWQLLLIPFMTAVLGCYCVAMRAMALSAVPGEPDPLRQEPQVGVETPDVELSDKKPDRREE